MANTRLRYFDMAKGLGIILVVLGHIEYISEPLRTWISSFHMPLFFIVSGMLICHKNESGQPLSSLIKKKARGILIPYLYFSLLYFVIDILNVRFGKITPETFVKDNIASLTFYGVSVLWFLPALFLAQILFLFLVKRTGRPLFALIASLVIAVSAYLLQLSLGPVYTASESSLLITSAIDFLRVFLRSMIATAYVAVGFVLFPLIEKEGSFSVKQLIAGIAAFLLNLPLCLINGCVDYHYMILNTVPLTFLCALLGSLSIILICKNMKPLDPLCFFGKNSLIVMSTHVNTYVLYAAIQIAWAIDTVVTRAKLYIFLFNIMAFTFLFEALIIVIINRFFPFVLGKGSLLSLFRRKEQ